LRRARPCDRPRSPRSPASTIPPFARFAKSPVKRTGRNRFVRNVLIAIGNAGDPTLAGEAERLLADASSMVRGAAIWALGRIDAARLAHLATQYRAVESDPSVQEEWSAALESRSSGREGGGTSQVWSGDA
jgi:epoxyqueuosine reductase